jgi:phospholipase D1/2
MAQAILRPNRNIWRLDKAARVAVVIDGAAYFQAVRESMLQARHSIFVVGWDIDSRMRLVGPAGRADDGFPETLAEFLSALVQRRPGLTIHLLLWDFSVLYALEREVFPALSLNWSTPDQVRFCLDTRAPLGCSQHQKIVVVDDAVAFSGGLDLTIRRWDTAAHDLDNPLRVDPAGEPYRPFHDVQAVVDGEAARALGDLVRQRWRAADCSTPAEADAGFDCWPDSVNPDFRNVSVGLSRTLPGCDGQKPVREVERLFLDSIDAAERTIYIENQFLTSEDIARRLAERMRRQPGLEVVMVAPDTPESWIEARTMRNGRIRFRAILEDAGVGDRMRLMSPVIERNGEVVSTMVHSKIMVVDDRLIRVGSANLNNRSMGADSECDLAIEAKSVDERAAILCVRNTLLGEHCGVTSDDVAAALMRRDSLVHAADTLSARGHRLRPIDDGTPDPEEVAVYMERLADPSRPWRWRTLYSWAGEATRVVASFTATRFLLLGVALLALTLAWSYSPLADYARPSVVQAALADVKSSIWAPAIALAAFLLGGLIAFPVTILIAATATTFGPWWGLLYAALGAMASAVMMYGVGAWLGRDSLRNFLGDRLNAIRKRIVKQGVIAIAAIRLVPVAPFTVVNLAAGASGIGLREYAAGTLLGLAPGLIAMAAFGHQIMRILSSPTWIEVAILVVGAALWIGMSFAIQAMISRYSPEAS